MAKSTVTKITIKIGKKEFELTPDEVKELKAELEKLYPSPVIKIERQLIPVKDYRQPFINTPKITFGDNTKELVTICNSYKEVSNG